MGNHDTSGLIPFFISLAFYIILAPILLILVLINEIIRLGVSLYLRNKYDGDIVLVPDGSDALWALKRKNKTRMAVAWFKLDKHIPSQKIKQRFEDVILQVRDSNGEKLYSKFTQILIKKCGYACWKKDSNFNMKNHIRSLPDKKVYNKKDIQKEMIKTFEDMSEDKPQWEIITIPRFIESAGESETSLLIYRFQHAYMDGLSMSTMLANHMGTGNTYFFHPQQFKIPFGKKILFYLNAVIFGPYAFIVVCLNKFKSFWPLQIPKDPTTQFKIYQTWTKSMNFEDIKKLRKKLDNASIPTIVENAFISAAKEILPPGRIPEQLLVGELAALLPYPDERPQNRFAVFVYNINSHLPDFERIQASKKDSWKGMTGPWIPMSFFVFKISGRLPMFMHYIVFGGGCYSLMMSNLPLSKTKYRMLDTANLLEVLAFPPQPNDTGITLLSATYDNSLKISASAESSWLKEDELQQIVDRIPKILNEWLIKTGEIREMKKNVHGQ